MGGADQWGNITAGLELIRRRAGGAEGEDERAHGIAYPLLLSPSGAKFGKSEGGESVWLDPERTSPYAFYQYWLNTDDRDVGTYLRWFTLKSREEIEALEAELQAAPEGRSAQRALAGDITTRDARRRTRPRGPSPLRRRRSPASRSSIPTSCRRCTTMPAASTSADEQRRGGVARFLVDAGVLGSLGEARRLIAGGGLTVARHTGRLAGRPRPGARRGRVDAGPDRQAQAAGRAARPLAVRSAAVRGSGDQAVVLRSVADGQAQRVRQADARPGTSAGRGRGGGARRPRGRRRRGSSNVTSRKLVTDGPTDQPTSVKALAPAARVRRRPARRWHASPSARGAPP